MRTTRSLDAPLALLCASGLTYCPNSDCCDDSPACDHICNGG